MSKKVDFSKYVFDRPDRPKATPAQAVEGQEPVPEAATARREASPTPPRKRKRAAKQEDPTSQPLDVPLVVRFSQADADLLDCAAHAFGTRKSTIARNAILKELQRLASTYRKRTGNDLSTARPLTLPR